MNIRPNSFSRITRPKTASASGFTLIELLVVIGIIAILVAVSTGSVMMGLKAAQVAKCSSNMRQIAVGFEGYLGDHNNCMPERVYGNGTPYFVVLNPYTGGSLTDKRSTVFVCPAQTSNDFPNEPSYGMNWYYDNASIATIAEPSTTIMDAETYGPTGTGSNRADRNSGDPGELDPTRHSGMSNYLFFDGHIEKLPYSATIVPIGASDMWGTDDGNHAVQTPP
jgi:prepilin-type N-terminal cleavage/methylation domain-containing protein/prepilin-type processing-associated H-X9-DG protein